MVRRGQHSLRGPGPYRSDPAVGPDDGRRAAAALRADACVAALDRGPVARPAGVFGLVRHPLARRLLADLAARGSRTRAGAVRRRLLFLFSDPHLPGRPDLRAVLAALAALILLPAAFKGRMVVARGRGLHRVSGRRRLYAQLLFLIPVFQRALPGHPLPASAAAARGLARRLRARRRRLRPLALLPPDPGAVLVGGVDPSDPVLARPARHAFREHGLRHRLPRRGARRLHPDAGLGRRRRGRRKSAGLAEAAGP